MGNLKVFLFNLCKKLFPVFLLLYMACLPPFQNLSIHQKMKWIGNTPLPKDELRAVWMSRFEYAKYSPTHDQDSIKQFIESTFRLAAMANFNVIFFQVRGHGDAYYTPGLEPWGDLLTGELGKDPGWDPLQFAIETAHYYGLELHAWINTFPIWRGTELPSDTVQPTPPILLHENWLVCDSTGTPMELSDHYVSLSPGIPAVHDYLISIASDIVERYKIDGIHFDYIRYPEGSEDMHYSHDSVSVARYNSMDGNPQNLQWADWQRIQVNTLVRKMYDTLMVIDPHLKISAAVIGSYQRNGWNAYNAVYQDAGSWTSEENMDFIVPMIYWPRSHENYGFLNLVEEYRTVTSNRYLIPGIGSYKYNTAERPYTWNEATGQIDDLRKRNFSGMCFFASRSLADHWEELAMSRFRYPSNIPPFTWKDSIPPAAPKFISVTRKENTIIVQWLASKNSDVKRYNIYFSNSENIDFTAANYLWYVTPDAGCLWQIPFDSTATGYIAISALDASWNESIPSAIQVIPETAK